MQRQIYSVLSAGILCIFSIAVSNIRPTITKNNASSKLLDPCQVLINSSHRVSQAAWSPDGKRIVFITQSEVNDPGQQVSVINADGTGYTRLITYKPKTFYAGNKAVGFITFTPQHPRWLSDNLHIIFRLLEEHRSEPGVAFNELYVMINSKSLATDIIVGTASTFLRIGTSKSVSLEPFAFSVSPNDQIFAFYNLGKLTFLSLKNQNTDNLALLPSVATSSEDFSWSPDSHYVIIADGVLHLVDVNASFKIIDLPLSAKGKVVWLPDGSKIAYVNDGVYIANPNGTDSQQVTSYQDKTVVRIDSDPGWLANGAKIGFVSQRNQDTELYTVDVQDHIERQITYGNSSNQPLTTAWSPDGERIVFLFLNTLQFAFTNTSCQIVGT